MSAAPLSRDHAFLSMTSPLGKDVLVPVALRLEEAVNRPFLGVLEVVSSRAQIDPDALLHQPVCVALRRTGAPVRYVHGRVRSVVATGPRGRDMHGWRLEIVPAMWFLSQTGDCRIFENRSAKDILQTLCGEAGVEVEFTVRGARTRPFTVQYNETDFDFFMRLVEEEGWLFLFRHTATAHKLVVADGLGFAEDVPGGPLALAAARGPDCLAEWRVGRATAHGRIAMADYDPDRPNAEPHGDTSTTFRTAGAPARDLFHWPARDLASGDITQRTRRLIEAAEAAATLAGGVSFNENFVPGRRIGVRGPEGTKTFVLLGVEHEASDDTWTNAAAPPGYRNSFTAFPADMPWRPQPVTRRPRMEGIYSAVVIGPEGEEIHTDELGRVKLRFRWDHRRDATPGGAAWVRVMQGWAGAKTGWFAIPRIGTEVAVAFMDGDAERPVVVGQLHNASQKPPLSLPEQKTRTGLCTRSTPQGGAQDCSELWFEDRKGEELVLLHAQKDLTVEAENDSVHSVGNDRRTTIRKGDDTLTVSQGNRSVDVPLGNHSITSTKGDISIRTRAGAVAVEAMTSLTLKVGQSSITLSQAGVSIKGISVKIEGQLLASIKGTVTELDADALLKASSAIMLLN